VSITGYRHLSAEEIDLVNFLKATEQDLLRQVRDIQNRIALQHRDAESPEELLRLGNAEPGRWANIARTHFQEGFMALIRSVTQPAS
jgi:hypothetical protein